jgi:hypothetical protein
LREIGVVTASASEWMIDPRISPLSNHPKIRRLIAMRLADIPQLQGLSLSEKMLLVEELWDVIAKNESALPIPAWHEQALAEDAVRYAANPAEGSSWADVKRRITG